MQSLSGSGALHLWCAYPDDLLDPKAADACTALLSTEEHERRRRFRFEQSRREYTATHAMVRTALSHSRPTAPQDWQFTRNAHGKPALTPDCGMRFNLSHTAGLAVCLVAETPVEVGVDVEAHARAGQIANVAHKVFSPAELEQVEALSDTAKLDRCLSLWTLKEAYIKARGIGLTLPLRGISFLFEDATAVRLDLGAELQDDAARWQFRLLNHARHRIAMVTESLSGGDLKMWEFHPPPAPPVQLSTERRGE